MEFRGQTPRLAKFHALCKINRFKFEPLTIKPLISKLQWPPLSRHVKNGNNLFNLQRSNRIFKTRTSQRDQQVGRRLMLMSLAESEFLHVFDGLVEAIEAHRCQSCAQTICDCLLF